MYEIVYVPFSISEKTITKCAKIPVHMFNFFRSIVAKHHNRRISFNSKYDYRKISFAIVVF